MCWLCLQLNEAFILALFYANLKWAHFRCLYFVLTHIFPVTSLFKKSVATVRR